MWIWSFLRLHRFAVRVARCGLLSLQFVRTCRSMLLQTSFRTLAFHGIGFQLSANHHKRGPVDILWVLLDVVVFNMASRHFCEKDGDDRARTNEVTVLRNESCSEWQETPAGDVRATSLSTCRPHLQPLSWWNVWCGIPRHLRAHKIAIADCVHVQSFHPQHYRRIFLCLPQTETQMSHHQNLNNS